MHVCPRWILWLVPFGLAVALAVPAQAADEVTVQQVDRNQFRQQVAAHKGKVVLVDFWATWCAPCKEMFSKTVDLHTKYADQGLAVISVSFDEPDDESQALEFLQYKQANFTNLISKDGFDSIETFQIENGALPHYQLYDRHGKLVKSFVSGDPAQVFREEDIEAAVQQLLQQRD